MKTAVSLYFCRRPFLNAVAVNTHPQPAITGLTEQTTYLICLQSGGLLEAREGGQWLGNYGRSPLKIYNGDLLVLKCTRAQ